MITKPIGCVLKKLLCASLLSAAFLPTANASNLLPLELGNTWTLRNAGAQFVFTVDEVTRSASGKLVRLRFQNPYAEHSWIVLDEPSSIKLVGYAFNGIESFFDEPTPLFPSNGITGQVWTGPSTKVTQKASNVQVTTSAGTFRNGIDFEVQFSDGSKQRWVVAPGVGFLAAGDRASQIPLVSYRLNPAVAFAAPPASCVKVGVAAIPVDAGLRTAEREAALAPVARVNGNLISVSIAWNELEPSPHRYAAERVRDEIQIAVKNRMDIALSIRPVDNVRDMRPADLQGKAWDDPELMNRFAAALDHVLVNLPPEVRWVNIGYEVDPYFLYRTNEIAPFVTFFRFSKDLVKRTTGRSTGVVFSFDVARGNSTAYRAFERDCDHVAFNYYALRSGSGFMHRSTGSPTLDVLTMRSLVRNRPLLITEAGYSSNPVVGGGATAQATFLRNLFTQMRAAPVAAAVNVWALNDMPEADVRGALVAYGIQPMPGSVEFISGLGLFNSVGVAKASWSTVSTEITNSATACSRLP